MEKVDHHKIISNLPICDAVWVVIDKLEILLMPRARSGFLGREPSSEPCSSPIALLIRLSFTNYIRNNFFRCDYKPLLDQIFTQSALLHIDKSHPATNLALQHTLSQLWRQTTSPNR